MKFVTNKYGQQVCLIGSKFTKPEMVIASVLDEIGVEYKTQFYFDEKGLKNKKYDAAVFDNDGNLAFLIEFDGPCHYDPEFYKDYGNRPERNKCHVIRAIIGDAEKTKIASDKGVPLLRITYLQMDILRDYILAYVWTFVDKNEETAKEIALVKMLDKYGWDFDYTLPSELGKKEEAFFKERGDI